jgi:hypothetical protein
MYSKTGLWLEVGFLLFTFFVVVPSIAGVIGYAAWKGKPEEFSREMYWTAFAAAGGVSLFLMVYAHECALTLEHAVSTSNRVLRFRCAAFWCRRWLYGRDIHTSAHSTDPRPT